MGHSTSIQQEKNRNDTSLSQILPKIAPTGGIIQV